MKKTKAAYKKNFNRSRRKFAIRNKISGTVEIPRLTVTRSLKNFTVQLIDDVNGHTLLSLSTTSKDVKIDSSKKRTEQSFELGKQFGELAKAKKITKIVFDRNGYLFHGRVKAFADGVKKSGLEF